MAAVAALSDFCQTLYAAQTRVLIVIDGRQEKGFSAVVWGNQTEKEDIAIKLMFSWQSQQFCECCDPRNFDRKLWHVMGVLKWNGCWVLGIFSVGIFGGNTKP